MSRPSSRQLLATTTPLTGYQRRLLAFLSVATFFEGYDFTALGQILPNLRAEMGLSENGGGQLVAIIGIGTILSYGLVRLADRWGRRRVLTITIVGYTCFTFLTGFSRTAYDFGAYQFMARIFLVAEWALSAVFAAEEFPADRRGFVLGLLQASTALGSIVCAAVVPILLASQLEWRAVYFVGVIPLVLLAYARRNLRETARFAELRSGASAPTGMMELWRSPYRRRMLQLALIWSLTYICTQSAVIFWKEFAVGERGFSDAQVGLAVAFASISSLPFIFAIGRMIDVLGRRRGAILVYGVCGSFVVAAYQLHNFWLLTACLMAAIFSAIGILTILNAYTTELFPTSMRAAAFAWSNNLLGRVGYIVGPSLVGLMAGSLGWGNAVSLTAVSVFAALALILVALPETTGRELEETAAI